MQNILMILYNTFYYMPTFQNSSGTKKMLKFCVSSFTRQQVVPAIVYISAYVPMTRRAHTV